MAGKAGRTIAQLSAVGLAAAAATGAYTLSAPLWAVPLAALGTWSTLQLLVVRPVSAASPSPASLPDLEPATSVEDVVRASHKILALSESAADPLVRQRGRDIAAALDRVIDHLRQDPDDLRSSAKFLSVYIERTKYILARYVQYENLATPQAETVRAKVRDELLPLLVQLCEAQLQRITYDDLRSLETDVDVLSKAMSLEGL